MMELLKTFDWIFIVIVLCCPIIIIFELLINGVWSYFSERKSEINKKKIILCAAVLALTCLLNVYVLKNDFIANRAFYAVGVVTVTAVVIWAAVMLLFKLILKVANYFSMRKIFDGKSQSVTHKS